MARGITNKVTLVTGSASGIGRATAIAFAREGARLVIADYAAAPGAGASVGKTFHRIDEDFLKKEVEAAGFKFVDEGNFLRNPNDPHNLVIFNSKIPVDIFVVKFQKVK